MEAKRRWALLEVGVFKGGDENPFRQTNPTARHKTPEGPQGLGLKGESAGRGHHHGYLTQE